MHARTHAREKSMNFGARLLIWMHLFFFEICCMITGLPYLVLHFTYLPNADKNIYLGGSGEDGVDTVEVVTSMKIVPFWGRLVASMFSNPAYPNGHGNIT